MPIASERLTEIAVELARRPRHEKVRALVYELLVHGLGASSSEVDFERPLPEVHGRVDALLGRTVFEFKSDLRREWRDVEGRLPDYLAQREKETGNHFVGIATDGAAFVPCELRGGVLIRLEAFVNLADHPRELLAWLGAAVAVGDDLEPTPEIVRRELGRESLAWQVAYQELRALWETAGVTPEVSLKRDLWARLLERVYGAAVAEEADDLFFQHTYLSIIAKTMAMHVLGISMPAPADLLSGRPFREAGISGVVEADFFDWLLAAPGGNELVRRVAAHAGRFRLRDVRSDVLKGLYESLVDPRQRHELGEYYTPDWLAARICGEAITEPLERRVLDPSCGSGTFLFHAVRLLLATAETAGIQTGEAVALACRRVIGVDIHPVAVQIARVTYLLAIGKDRLRDRPADLAIPVYLGDSLQWNTQQWMADREVLVEVPEDARVLEFPHDVARDPAVFDSVIGMMLRYSDQGAPAESLRAWLVREHALPASSVDRLASTYDTLRDLHQRGRDHIWGFITRNLVRPVWLSQEEQRADVLVGNPPWLSYRYMSREMQARFRTECQQRGLWAGGRVATHQDLSGYFFARCVELYLRAGGRIAFVMPYAAMTRRQFEGFRAGVYGERQGRDLGRVLATVRFTAAWAFSDAVQPLFPVPSCVLFARRQEAAPLPTTVLAASGALPRRDASPMEAAGALTWTEALWPRLADDDSAVSPYRDAFNQGATMVPRVLCVVERAPVGDLGGNRAAPVVMSRRSSQEKRPWKDLPLMRGNVEAAFVRPLYLGESIAPFRVLEPVLSVVPWDPHGGALMDAAGAQAGGYPHLAGWLREAEVLWVRHGRGRLTFLEQIDYYGKLTAQFPVPPLRVVYSKAGTLPAAAILREPVAVVDHTLYWMPVSTGGEGRYLLAILNSETARRRVETQQARGQWGARHFDKVLFSLPIPRYDQTNPIHRALATAAARAEGVAASVTLRERMHFVSARRAIRRALVEDGVAARMEALVEQLLGPV